MASRHCSAFLRSSRFGHEKYKKAKDIPKNTTAHAKAWSSQSSLWHAPRAALQQIFCKVTWEVITLPIRARDSGHSKTFSKVQAT